jgi:hypothetical protein
MGFISHSPIHKMGFYFSKRGVHTESMMGKLPVLDARPGEGKKGNAILENRNFIAHLPW